MAAIVSLVGVLLVAFFAPHAQNYFSNKQPIIQELIPSQTSPQSAFSVVTWSAKATDREGDTIYYDFFLKGPTTNGKLVDMTGWVSSADWIWQTSESDAGENTVLVKVNDLNHLNLDYSNQKDKIFIINFEPFSQNQNRQCKSLLTHGRYLSALKCYNYSIKINPNDADALYNRGKTFYNLGRISEALSDYDRAIEFDSNLTDASIDKIYALASMGNYSEAIKCSDKLIPNDPDNPRIFYQRGLIYSIKKDNNLALDNFNRAIKLNPKYVNSLQGRAIVLNRLKNYSEALRSVEEGINLSPDSADLWYIKYTALVGLKRTNEAKNALNTSEKLGHDSI
jgi:tetratricopeptide (TPR) repeat protein